MSLDEKWTSALRPDAQGFDEVRIKTIPRFKQSGMSGDEWRISAQVELLRKGKVIKSTGYGDVKSAASFLSWFMVSTIENGGGEFGGIDNACDQEGCAEVPTVFYAVKKDWCQRCGSEREHVSKTYRKFCAKHKTRGDCGLDDCDSNYFLLESDPR